MQKSIIAQMHLQHCKRIVANTQGTRRLFCLNHCISKSPFQSQSLKICLATLVPHGHRGKLPNYEPLSMAFASIVDKNNDNHNSHDDHNQYENLIPDNNDDLWVGSPCLRSSRCITTNQSTFYKAQNIAKGMEDIIGKRDCWQIITLWDSEHTNMEVCLRRTKYGISRGTVPNSVHVHTICSVDNNKKKVQRSKDSKIFSFDSLKRTLQQRHGRYWLDHVIIIEDSPCINSTSTVWTEHTFYLNCNRH